KKRPETNEYNPYYLTYINLVGEGDIVDILSQQIKETVEQLKGLTEEQAHFRYAPDKWTIKEVIGHIADTERIMSYRL
ncbi:DinB family protein, partial [Salmonella sp. gx-f4]|nr:DinB family protein [Salmonella sp. gx-f4]